MRNGLGSASEDEARYSVLDPSMKLCGPPLLRCEIVPSVVVELMSILPALSPRSEYTAVCALLDAIIPGAKADAVANDADLDPLVLPPSSLSERLEVIDRPPYDDPPPNDDPPRENARLLPEVVRCMLDDALLSALSRATLPLRSSAIAAALSEG